MHLEIEPRLPDDCGEGEDTSFLDAAEIVRLGTIEADGQPALAIAYRKEETAELVTIRFSELGLWIVSRKCLAGRPPSPDLAA